MKKFQDFKDQSAEELKAMYHDLSKDIYELKNEVSMTRKIDKPHLVRDKKRNRARVLTALKQKGERI